MSALARIVGGVALVGYLLIWFPMAWMVMIVWDEGLTPFAWMIVYVNPLTIGAAAWATTRAERRWKRHG